MAEKEVKVKVSTEADTSGLEDIEKTISDLDNKTVKIPVEAESPSWYELQAQIEELENQQLLIKMGVVDGDMDEVQARIDELKEQQFNLTVNVDDSNVEELETELDELETKEFGLTVGVDSSGVDEAAAGLGDVESSADNATSALETMAGLQIGETLAQWGAQAEGFAQNLDNMAISTEQLAIQTGMTDSQMTGMLNNITNATFPREEALMYVQSLDQIGVSAQNLGTSATGLDKINDAFHMGAPAVNKLGQELSVLGVDMNNVSSSYNALAYANANTVGGMENFSKFLTRFDADFNKLGLNVDQAAVAIAGATHKFGGGRAALSGMSSALKECNGDLGQLEQALGLEAGALRNASNLTGQYNGQLDQMAAKEGQHKTLTQQLAAALDDVTASFAGALAPFASFLGLMGQFGGAAVGANALLTLPGNLKEAASAMKSLNLATKAYAAAEAIANGVRTIATALQNALNLSMLANPYFLVAAAILALVAALIYCYNTNEEFRNSVNQLYNDLVRLASGDWHVVLEYEQKGGDVAVDTAGMLANNDLSQGLSRMLMGDEAVNEANANMDGFLENIKTKLHEGMEAFWNDGTQGLFGWLGQVAGIDVGSYFTNFTNAFMSIPQWISQATQQGIGQLQAFNAQVNGVLQGIIGYVSGWGSNLVSQFSSSASNAASSFISGISGLASSFSAELSAIISDAWNFAGELGAAMWSAANQAWSQFLSGLGIHSPGIMQRNYEAEMLGIIQHAQATEQPLGSAMRSVGESAVNNFDITGLNIPTLPTGGTQASGGGVTMNIVINGDVDSEERMERFADYIINRMTFSNDTAGRTV